MWLSWLNAEFKETPSRWPFKVHVWSSPALYWNGRRCIGAVRLCAIPMLNSKCIWALVFFISLFKVKINISQHIFVIELFTEWHVRPSVHLVQWIKCMQGWDGIEPQPHLRQSSRRKSSGAAAHHKSMTPEHISIKSQCLVIPAVIQRLLIAQYEHKLDHFDVQGTLPIGVIRCAAAKASPIENLPWVTYLPCGCLKKS